MNKTINDLYAESQMALVNESAANLAAVQALARLVKGELKTEWFTIIESGGNIQWSFKIPEPDAPTIDTVTQPN